MTFAHSFRRNVGRAASCMSQHAKGSHAQSPAASFFGGQTATTAQRSATSSGIDSGSFKSFGKATFGPNCGFAFSGLQSTLTTVVSTQAGASVVQVRSGSTSVGESEGDDEASTLNVSKDEPPDRYGGSDEDILNKAIQDLTGMKEEVKEQRANNNVSRAIRTEQEDPLEYLLFSKDQFAKKDQKLIPIPPAVRDVMFKYTWDKYLVGCRRTLIRNSRTMKTEVYTSMVAIGNGKGLFALGVCTSPMPQASVGGAYMDAFKNIHYIPLYRGHTVYETLEEKINANKVQIRPRTEGFGLTAGTTMYELCTLVGIKNATVKVIGPRNNKFFWAQGFLNALLRQSTPADGVESTGMYIRERYHAGANLPYGIVRGKDIP